MPKVRLHELVMMVAGAALVLLIALEVRAGVTTKEVTTAAGTQTLIIHTWRLEDSKPPMICTSSSFEKHDWRRPQISCAPIPIRPKAFFLFLCNLLPWVCYQDVAVLACEEDPWLNCEQR